jgi:hypothetical protein
VETWEHIREVREGLRLFTDELHRRGVVHDLSKLLPPEIEAFDEATPVLAKLTYGSDEYKAQLLKLKPALEHHYAFNSHHPEHHERGIRGMSLFDIVEMFCDWQAAVKRHKDGDLTRSIDINQKRFGFSDELADIFRNTLAEVVSLQEEEEEKRA